MSKTPTNVIIVDDEDAIRKLLSARCTREGWTVNCYEDAKHAITFVKPSESGTVIVTDIKMPGMTGFEFIQAIRAKGVECPVVVITGHGDKEHAIEAVHQGAFDYLEKPFDMDKIADVITRAAEQDNVRLAKNRQMKELDVNNKKLSSKLEVATELLERAEKTHNGDSILLGNSEHISSLKAMVHTIAESFRGDHDPVVLVTGESGTGKEVVARYIHEVTWGNEAKTRPFVAINCAAFPEQLLESELFGYEKGAFTGANTRKMGLFELASNGTLFLDEIGEMDLKMQAKLLRALQERVIRRLGGTTDIAVKPHIVAATNRELAKAVSEKTFREDLYYRLNTIPIAVAPLRSRSEDIEVLANAFLKKLSAGRAKRFTGLSASALKALTSYNWPGNVRELKSVIERAVILEKGPVIELSHLRQEHLQAIKGSVRAASQTEGEVVPFTGNKVNDVPTGAPETVTSDIIKKIEEKGLTLLRKEMDENFVKQVLVESLSHDTGNVSSVARRLKLDRANLLRMLKRFSIEPEFFRNGRKAG